MPMLYSSFQTTPLITRCWACSRMSVFRHLLSFHGLPYPCEVQWLTYLHQFVAVPSPLSAAHGYHIHADKVAEELARGTSVILTSNPRNPTGHALAPDELIKIQDICRG